MLNRLKRIGSYLAALIVAIYVAFKVGMRKEAYEERVREAEDSYAAERMRRRIDEDVQEDTDLADRARRAGVVRKD